MKVSKNVVKIHIKYCTGWGYRTSVNELDQFINKKLYDSYQAEQFGVSNPQDVVM